MGMIMRVVSSALEDGLRRESVYGGDLLVFEDVPPLEEFCAFTDAMIREVFGATDPARTQLEPGGDEYLCFGVEAHTVEPGTRRTAAARPTWMAKPPA